MFVDVAAYWPLSPWQKVGIMAAGALVIGLTVLFVVCLVCPGCLFYAAFLKGAWVQCPLLCTVYVIHACVIALQLAVVLEYHMSPPRRE